MGTSQSKPPLPSTLKPITDSKYGGRIFIDSSQTRVYQIIDIDESNIDNFTNLMNQRKQLRFPIFLTINRSWIQEYRESCSLHKMYRVTLEYIYIGNCLQDQIIKYCEIKVPMPQAEIRKYFSDIVSCLEYLKSKKTCHGDIKAKTILISSNGRAFLADSYFLHGGKVSFQIVMEDPQSLSLLSPTQLQSLKNKKFVSLKQVYQDQIFQVGLTMMEAMTAEPSMECYDLANLCLKPQFFRRKYGQMIDCGYSTQLCQLVMRCVEFSPEKRIKFREFLQAINNTPLQPIPNQNFANRIPPANKNIVNFQHSPTNNINFRP